MSNIKIKIIFSTVIIVFLATITFFAYADPFGPLIGGGVSGPPGLGGEEEFEEGDALLLEGGVDFLLLEGGTDKLLLE